MATVIDELIVKLGLDSKGFEEGQKKVGTGLDETRKKTDRVGRDIAGSGRQAAEFFGQMQKSAIKFFAVITAGRGALNFIKDTITGGASLDRLATNLNTSADSLHKWGNAVKQSGGSVSGFTATMQGLSEAVTEQQQGGSGLTKYLADLGVSLVDNQGKVKQLETLLLDIGEGVQRRIPNRPDQVNIMKQMGIDEGTINLLLRGRKEAEALIAAQSGYSKDDAAKARDAEEKWLAAQEKINKLMRDMVYLMLPAAASIVDALSKLFKEMEPTLKTIADGFVSLNTSTEGWLGNILLALAALRLIGGLGILGGGAKAAGSAIAGGALGASVGAAVALKGDTAPDQQGASALMQKAKAGDRDSAMQLARIQLDNQLWRKLFGKKASEHEVKDRANEIMGSKGQEFSGKIEGFEKPKPLNSSNSISDYITKAESENKLPPGVLSSIVKQEIGNRKEFIEDPAKYHYEKDESGKRKSSAFGPYGILDSTAKDPGYGVKPLQDKSLEEQTRFASDYLAARIKQAGGSLQKALAGYGEGQKYANEVMFRMPEGSRAMTGVQAQNQVGSQQGNQNISIGELNINTAATDARGIARDIRRELVAQSNSGLR